MKGMARAWVEIAVFALVLGVGMELGRYITFGLMVKWFGFGGY